MNKKFHQHKLDRRASLVWDSSPTKKKKISDFKTPLPFELKGWLSLLTIEKASSHSERKSTITCVCVNLWLFPDTSKHTLGRRKSSLNILVYNLFNFCFRQRLPLQSFPKPAWKSRLVKLTWTCQTKHVQIRGGCLCNQKSASAALDWFNNDDQVITSSRCKAKDMLSVFSYLLHYLSE